MADDSVLKVAAELLHLAYDDRIPDDLADALRSRAIRLRDLHDSTRRVVHLTPSRQTTVGHCSVCEAACVSCLMRLPDPHQYAATAEES